MEDEFADQYHREPEEVFLPLGEKRWARYYDLEMADYCEDRLYYQKRLTEAGRVLELGCGSGRIAAALAKDDRTVVGIDIAKARLAAAQQLACPGFAPLCMDMTALGFAAASFHAILIPYNTLNLILDRQKLQNCLNECKRVLRPGAEIHLQLHTPADSFCQNGKKTFQFMICKRPGGGKVIKEILKKYDPRQKTIDVEERYRVRPMTVPEANKDYCQRYTILGFSAAIWFKLFTDSGFVIENLAGGFDGRPYLAGESTELIVSLRLNS